MLWGASSTKAMVGGVRRIGARWEIDGVEGDVEGNELDIVGDVATVIPTNKPRRYYGEKLRSRLKPNSGIPSARTAIPESDRDQGKRTKPHYELTSTEKEEETASGSACLHVSERRNKARFRERRGHICW